MAWKEMFDEKFMTAEEAAKMINSGDVVWVGALTSGAPQVVDAVTDRYEELENVRLVGDFSLTEYKCFKSSKYKGHLQGQLYTNILAQCGRQRCLPIL